MTQLPLFKSYFKLALRHSWKNKWSVMINVVGLGLALSMCVFVYSIFAYNIEFDDFYDKTEDVYRIYGMTMDNGQERVNDFTPLPFLSVLNNDLAGVKQTSAFMDRSMSVKKGGDYFEEVIGVVTENFFEMFDIPLWYGSFADFGEEPIVFLTKPTAKRYFGNEVALGEKLSIYLDNENKLEVTVGGVFERVPLNSSFNFDILLSLGNYTRARQLETNSWDEFTYVSQYVRTTPDQVDFIESKLSEFLPRQNETHAAFKMTRLELVPFKSAIHNDRNIYRNNANTRLDYSIHIIFTVLAGMVFLIACFNLANTSMAMIAKRLKEIGIRKTIGSENRQILLQFLLEMGIVCALAFIIALSMINWTSSSIMSLFGETFLIKDIDLTGVILFVGGFLIFTTLVAGLLPALYAWKFQPVEIMRKDVKLKGIGWLNKGLTVAQFSFSIAVLSAAITFSQNLSFLDNLNLGYENEQIYVLDLGQASEYKEVKQRVDQIAGVHTAGTFHHIQNYGRSSWRSEVQVDTSIHEIRSYTISNDYVPIMEIPIISGRNFRGGSVADEDAILVNQEFAERFFKDQEALNQVVKIGEGRKTIIGIFPNLIDDVYIDSEEVPVILHYRVADQFRFLIAKVNHASKQEVEAQIKTIWNDLVDRPFDGSWQKDLAFGSAVRDTDNLKQIFLAMAILGGFLSIVGIFSLAKLNIAKRIKEISIRKVLGSTMKGLILTINKSFFIVLAIALVAGGALGFLVSGMVLQMIYRIYVDITPVTSIAAGTFVILLSVIVLTASTLTPARSNPVLGLREE